jgi:uncharacterized RDD family membrane protein YckC
VPIVPNEDRVTIATPEGIEITMLLAGLASRFIAAIVDHAIQFALAAVAGLLALGLGADGAAGIVLFSLASFAITFGYHVLFETLAGGRTPGKRLSGLRVVTAVGGPITFRTSAIRNLLRVVDFLPAAYATGATLIVATRRNQRLGDLAAGTLVVRLPREGEAQAPAPAAPLDEDLAFWDVSAVSAEEAAAVRRFLERRASLTPQARRHLASHLAGRLAPRVAGAPEDLEPEPFLERLAAAKAARR